MKSYFWMQDAPSPSSASLALCRPTAPPSMLFTVIADNFESNCMPKVSSPRARVSSKRRGPSRSLPNASCSPLGSSRSTCLPLGSSFPSSRFGSPASAAAEAPTTKPPPLRSAAAARAEAANTDSEANTCSKTNTGSSFTHVRSCGSFSFAPQHHMAPPAPPPRGGNAGAAGDGDGVAEAGRRSARGYVLGAEGESLCEP
mmetsp:Transcript_92756/g.235951  ORF Transcript_92756/g.235951 Transcript_92756/m.235951 type:complete len:200 (-) Transcript_92756:8-607(-)